MATLTQANRQWASRPDDERFESLIALHAHTTEQHRQSASRIISSRALSVRASEDNGLEIHGANGVGFEPTHWSFGQLSMLAGAPANYMRALPAPLAADCLNHGLQRRNVDEIGVLLRRNGHNEIAAATGPKYGRVWNEEITKQLVDRFGDGVTGDWRVPGEFGKAVEVSKANTTLYASDRDLFVFLADETNRIELPNRRNGETGSLARGFFVWNSEVGATSFGVGTFLFDYVCSNRMVWGAEGYKEITLRHTMSAPDRFAEEVIPILADMRASSPKPIEMELIAAQNAKIESLEALLVPRGFTATATAKINAVFEEDEGHPVESIWDAATALTGYAKRNAYQNERIAMEREAGKLLDLVAA